MMRPVRHIIGLIIALLITAFGTLAMPIESTASQPIDFFRYQEAVVAEHTNVHFAIRAPPIAVDKVAFTGIAVAEHGNRVIMHAHEIHVASLGFRADLYAPNRIPVPDDLPTNIHMGQQGKHVRGHNNFQEGRSYFNDGVDPSELLAGLHSGQYPIVGTGSRGNPIVDFGRPIGVDGRTGQTVTRGQIHYGNNGAHIVPDVRN